MAEENGSASMGMMVGLLLGVILIGGVLFMVFNGGNSAGPTVAIKAPVTTGSAK